MPNAHMRRMKLADAKMVLEWRNDDAIRYWMVNQKPISLEEHLSWFERNEKREDRYFLIFEYENVPEGYVSFVPVENSKAFEWGFYIRPNASKGLGKVLGETALSYAFNECDIFKVFGQVLSFNQKSISFHQKLGFIQEGLLQQHFYDERGVFDIYQFGLLKEDWQRGR